MELEKLSTLSDIPKLLKKVRVEKGYSIRGLAKAAGCTARAILYWESGERMMTLESADKVFRVLGVQIVLGGDYSAKTAEDRTAEERSGISGTDRKKADSTGKEPEGVSN